MTLSHGALRRKLLSLYNLILNGDINIKRKTLYDLKYIVFRLRNINKTRENWYNEKYICQFVDSLENEYGYL
jgi:hypothetical protein